MAGNHEIITDSALALALLDAGFTATRSERIAQVVRQIHFLERQLGEKDPAHNGKWLDGVHWTYQRYRDLHEYFPHWVSERALRDVVKTAERASLLIPRQWPYFKLYRVNYAGVRALCAKGGVEPPSWAAAATEGGLGVM